MNLALQVEEKLLLMKYYFSNKIVYRFEYHIALYN